MNKYLVRTIEGDANTSGADCMVIESPYAFYSYEHIDDKKSKDNVFEKWGIDDVIEVSLENGKTYRFTAL